VLADGDYNILALLRVRTAADDVRISVRERYPVDEARSSQPQSASIETDDVRLWIASLNGATVIKAALAQRYRAYEAARCCGPPFSLAHCTISLWACCGGTLHAATGTAPRHQGIGNARTHRQRPGCVHATAYRAQTALADCLITRVPAETVHRSCGGNEHASSLCGRISEGVFMCLCSVSVCL
jgi:hypothetical protein